MARGITSFHGYRRDLVLGGLTRYGCLHCMFAFIGAHKFPGNALARHAKSVALIKQHMAEKHADKLP